MKYVSDLIDDEGFLSAWEVISEKFDLSANAFSAWYGVIQSIPTELLYRHDIFTGDNSYGITKLN